MRSAMGPASASRRQASSEPLARTSSSSPARMSLSTALRTASAVTFVGRSTPRSLRREAVDRMTSWVSVSLVAIGISLALVRRHLPPPPPQPHLGHAAGGAGSQGTLGARNGYTTAPFADECQSFLDNVIARLGADWMNLLRRSATKGQMLQCADG